jgi:hypothetical protein
MLRTALPACLHPSSCPFLYALVLVTRPSIHLPGCLRRQVVGLVVQDTLDFDINYITFPL